VNQRHPGLGLQLPDAIKVWSLMTHTCCKVPHFSIRSSKSGALFFIAASLIGIKSPACDMLPAMSNS
jgi:hypothetical protein